MNRIVALLVAFSLLGACSTIKPKEPDRLAWYECARDYQQNREWLVRC